MGCIKLWGFLNQIVGIFIPSFGNFCTKLQDFFKSSVGDFDSKFWGFSTASPEKGGEEAQLAKPGVCVRLKLIF